MLLTLLLFLLKYNCGQTIRVISTDPTQSQPRDDGVAVISDSSIQHLEELTVCLRFITYNFDMTRLNPVLTVYDFGLLLSYSVISCYDQEEECELVPWKVYGRTNFETFPGWSPGEWRSVCMSGSSASQSWRITLDGRETVRSEYNSYHKRRSENILLMNLMEEFYRAPHHGAVSDLQVWSRLLDDDEVLQWLQCRSGLVGDFLSWETLQINITGLYTWDREKDDICPKEKKKYSK